MLDETIISTGIQGGGFSVLAYAVWEMRRAIDRNTQLIEKLLLKRCRK